MAVEEKAPEKKKPKERTSILDMPLGGENPNPGFLTDKGAPYVTEGSQQAAEESGQKEKPISNTP